MFENVLRDYLIEPVALLITSYLNFWSTLSQFLESIPLTERLSIIHVWWSSNLFCT